MCVCVCVFYDTLIDGVWAYKCINSATCPNAAFTYITIIKIEKLYSGHQQLLTASCPVSGALPIYIFYIYIFVCVFAVVYAFYVTYARLSV